MGPRNPFVRSCRNHTRLECVQTGTVYRYTIFDIGSLHRTARGCAPNTLGCSINSKRQQGSDLEVRMCIIAYFHGPLFCCEVKRRLIRRQSGTEVESKTEAESETEVKSGTEVDPETEVVAPEAFS